MCGAGAASNYTVSYRPGTLTVNRASLDNTAGNHRKPHALPPPRGSELTAFAPGASQLVGSDAVGSVTITDTNTGGGAGAAAGGRYALTPCAAVCSAGAASNYTIAYHPGTLTVNPAARDITANNDSKTHG